MSVPSGNDASYVLANYCGGIISPTTKTSKERISIFMENLNKYIKNKGYNNTILYDPSGFDTKAKTTVLDLKEVIKKLLKHQWFRPLISQSSYTAILPDKTTQTEKTPIPFLTQHQSIIIKM